MNMQNALCVTQAAELLAQNIESALSTLVEEGADVDTLRARAREMFNKADLGDSVGMLYPMVLPGPEDGERLRVQICNHYPHPLAVAWIDL